MNRPDSPPVQGKPLRVLRTLRNAGAALPSPQLAVSSQTSSHEISAILKSLEKRKLVVYVGTSAGSYGHPPAKKWEITTQGIEHVEAADAAASAEREEGSSDLATETTKILNEFKALGYEPRLTGKSHWQIRDRNGRLMITMSSTPSDHRGINQAKMLLRRLKSGSTQLPSKVGGMTTQPPPAVAPPTATAVKTHHPHWMPTGHPVTQCSQSYCGPMAEKLWAASETARSQGRSAPDAVQAVLDATKPKVPVPANPTGEMIPQTTTGHIDKAAAKVYSLAREMAARKGDKQNLNGDDGWVIKCHLSDIFRVIWPALEDPELPGAKNAVSAITEYLRRSGNITAVERKGRSETTWWVRDAYKQGPPGLGDLRTAQKKTKDTPRPAAKPEPARKPAPSAPAGRKKRNTGLSGDVLKVMQDNPGKIMSIAEISAAIGGVQTSVSRVVREWSEIPVSGITRLTRSSYVYLPKKETPQATGAVSTRPEDKAPEPQPAAEPVGVEEQQPPAPEPAGRRPLWVNPDAELFETVHKLRNGWRVIRDEEGKMYDLPPLEELQQ